MSFQVSSETEIFKKSSTCFLFVLNRLYFLGKFQAQSNTKQKVQGLPAEPLPSTRAAPGPTPQPP